MSYLRLTLTDAAAAVADELTARQIFTVQTGAPVIRRGADWPERPASGLLLRSPPIVGPDEMRLGPVLDAEDEA